MIGKLLPAPGTPRVLMFATLVNTFGNGAYLTTSALFLTRSVGLTPAQVAIGLSAAALAGMVLTTPMGYLVDRRGARGVQTGALVTLAASFAAMTLVRGLWSFTLLACVIAVGDATVKAANGAMIAGTVPAGERVRTRAFIRSTNNAGIALGTLSPRTSSAGACGEFRPATSRRRRPSPAPADPPHPPPLTCPPARTPPLAGPAGRPGPGYEPLAYRPDRTSRTGYEPSA